jgi:hypothetical protein
VTETIEMYVTGILAHSGNIGLRGLEALRYRL